jgi:tight adherence protein B
VTPTLFVLVFLAVLLAAEGTWALARGGLGLRRAALRRRLRRLASTLHAPDVPSEESILRRAGATRSLLGRALASLPFADALALQLYRAGHPFGLGTFVALSGGLALGGWALGGALLGSGLAALPGLALGFLPFVLVRRSLVRRARRFEEGFPDALDLVIRALRAGHSLTTGLQLVGRELPDPVGPEFAQVAHEIRLGQDVRSALANLAHRVRGTDLPFFVTAILVQQETGSNLAEVLENLSRVIRDRFELHGKVRALTALGRASANLLAVWPLVMVGALYAVNRDYVAPLWEGPRGHSLVLVSLALIAAGYAGCRRMARVRV